MRKRFLQNKEIVILPRGPKPTCSGPPCRRQLAALTHPSLSEKLPFQARKLSYSILGLQIKTNYPSWPCEQGIRGEKGWLKAEGQGWRWERKDLWRKGCLYLYENGFQFWFPIRITCKVLKISQCPCSTLDQLSLNLCGQGQQQVFLKKLRDSNVQPELKTTTVL